MGVPLFTTPTFTLTFSGTIDLTQAERVYVTFRSAGNLITKTGESLTIQAKSIGVSLTQEETGRFADRVAIQANWMIGNQRVATEVCYVDLSDQLLAEVIL